MECRGGVFLDSSFELEGNCGYMNHFRWKEPASKVAEVCGKLQETTIFQSRTGTSSRQFTPFMVVGLGAIRTQLPDVDSFKFNNPSNGRVTLAG